MRILDKNTDFYDYWQDVYRDTSTTFDRTDSFLLTKDMMCGLLRWNRSWCGKRDAHHFVLLQVCHTFWLFLVEVTKWDEYDDPQDYTIEPIATWKNYHKPRRLIQLDFIDFDWHVSRLFHDDDRWMEFDRTKLHKRMDALIHEIDAGNFRILKSADNHTVYKGDGIKESKHIPLLKACGLARFIDPLEIYLAFEEYLSLEKASLERTESVGLTDVERIGNHGFDVKTSFRGKRS